MSGHRFNGLMQSRARTRILLGLLILVLGGQQSMTAHANRAPASRWFWIGRSSGWQSILAIELASRRDVSIYAQRGVVSVHDARTIADVVQRRILPTDLRLFGTPRNLGHIDVLLTPLDGITLGYFNETDLTAAPSKRTHSNGGNVLYSRPPSAMPDRNKLADTEEVIAHELQHLLDFRLRVIDRGLSSQEDWLNEGLSFYAQLANQFFTERDRLKVDAAASEPGWRVTALNQSNQALIQHGRVAYGRAGLFVTYLAARFGPSYIRDVISDAHTGMSAVDAQLRVRHAYAGQVFGDWGVASLLNQSGPYGYGWFGHRFTMVPQSARSTVTSYPYDSASSFRLSPWSQLYLHFATRHDATLKVRVTGAAGHYRVALVGTGRSSLQPDVRWLRFDASGRAVVRLHDFGDTYTDAALVVSNVARGTAAEQVRIRADLVDVSYDNGVA